MKDMDFASAELLPRQIWVDPTPTSGSLPHTCTPFRLPSGGQVNIGRGTIITLTQDAAFQPPCGSTPIPPPLDPLQPGVDLAVLDAQEPWYSSTIPQIYAISTVTVVSYMLVIILFITPRTFFVGGAGGGGGFLGQTGVISGAHGSNSVIGIGSRPWLQKIAALTVAISMTIVTADTFTWAHRQYDAGYEDAKELTVNVIGGLEVRIVRVISETFLWLAQAQTLIRLFPRHKEKLMIKWIAFALIVLELIFSCLNHFLAKTNHSRRFVSAIPAMNYLFALTLNLAYGCFIIFYALQKRRFAFYHPHMRNMPLVALLSLTAVMIPVVFFILDLLSPNVSGWGKYVRWVGSAAASVVVWEWVERIEALERDEKKGGILGREIFDGDEMLDVTAGSDASWPTSQRKNGKTTRRDSKSGFSLSTGWSSVAARARRIGRSQQSHSTDTRDDLDSSVSQGQGEIPESEREGASDKMHQPMAPPIVAWPLSRTGRASAGSTIYDVRYHDVDGVTPSTHQNVEDPHQPPQRPDHQRMRTWVGESQENEPAGHTTASTRRQLLMESLQRMPNPFRRQRQTPPPEVARALAGRSQEPNAGQSHSDEHTGILEKLRVKKASKVKGPPRPVIVVPAPPRKRSPWRDALSEDEDEGNNDDNNCDDGISARQSQSISEYVSGNRDADSPPDAVLNAISGSGTVSPLSNTAPRDPP